MKLLLKLISLLVIISVAAVSCVSSYKGNYHNDFFESRNFIINHFSSAQHHIIIDMERDYLGRLSKISCTEGFPTIDELRYRAFTLSTNFEDFIRTYMVLLSDAVMFASAIHKSEVFHQLRLRD